jgi:hypothetical protein
MRILNVGNKRNQKFIDKIFQGFNHQVSRKYVKQTFI